MVLVMPKSTNGAESRLYRALPHWQEWPRPLRRTYLLLPSHGIGDGGIESIAKSIGLSEDRLKKLIADSPTFTKALAQYEKDGDYPPYPRVDGGTGNRISHALILDRYMAESSTGLYMQAEDALPASMVKEALAGIQTELDNDPTLATLKKTAQQKRDERDEAARAQLPTFDVMVEETREAAESVAD